MNINDVFPGPSNRPDHPDFWKLSDVVLQLDGKTEDPGFDFPSFLSEIIDPKVLAYMAMQRAMLVTSDPMSWPVLAGMWIDAFCAGREWANR